MTRLSIPDMSCGHCKASVEETITRVDPGASVMVDLNARTVEIQSTAPIPALIAALSDVGFPAAEV